MIRDLIEQAAAGSGDACYLEDAAGGGTLTYAGLRRAVLAWSGRLDQAGIPPGARVAVSLPDPLGYATVLVSILAAERVVVPLDPGAPAAEVSRVLAAARPDAAVSGAGGPDLEVLGQRSERDGPAAASGGRPAGFTCAPAGRPGPPRASCCTRASWRTWLRG